jgi:DNA-binding protein HU-beta
MTSEKNQRKREVFKMTKAELIAQIASETELTKKDVSKVLNALEEIIEEKLINGNEDYIPLGSLGKFIVVDVSERKVRNPQTGEEKIVPAHRKLKFKVSKKYKKIF